MGSKIEYLVVDTTAFIKNTALQDIASNIYTVQDVVDEIKNKRQLRSLVVLPYELAIKDVFPENVKYITDFSKKTGDYPSLSATDIKVMALTYQLEKEKVGTDHLKKDPQVNRVVNFSKESIDDVPKDIAGFFMPSSHKGDVAETDKLPRELQDEASSDRLQQELSAKFATLECRNIDEHDDEMEDVEDVLVHVKDRQEDIEVDEAARADDEGSDDGFHDYNSADEDEAGWITIENIEQIKKDMNKDGSDEEEDVVVACITADFAMQNVLKQMGLHVITVEGRQIRHLRTFILRCYSCFKTTSIMTKLFCPNCGNKTLKKVSVSLKDDGTQQIHINARRPLTARGKKFSLPTPKGGKHGSYPVVCEDQRFPHQRPTKLARMKNNPLEPDYIAGFSPFVMRDVNSRSAMIGVHGAEAKYWMKKNPNEAKRKSKK